MEISGKIVSTQLGRFGNKDIVYGFLGIETEPGKQTKIKVDSYTEYAEGVKLEIGKRVEIETEYLGSTDILVARSIQLADRESKTPHVKDAPTAVT